MAAASRNNPASPEGAERSPGPTDVLIIGSGIAGATTALRLARNPGRRVTVVTREEDPKQSNTRWAQPPEPEPALLKPPGFCPKRVRGCCRKSWWRRRGSPSIGGIPANWSLDGRPPTRAGG